MGVRGQSGPARRRRAAAPAMFKYGCRQCADVWRLTLAAAAVAVAAAALAAPPTAGAQGQAEFQIPEWIRASAGWWADGSITDSDFLGGVEYLAGAGVITLPPAEGGAPGSRGGGDGGLVPEWVKASAGWWADGSITDSDFVGSLQYLAGKGLIRVGGSDAADGRIAAPAPGEPELAALEAALASCADIVRAYERLDCERDAKGSIEAYRYRTTAAAYDVGPVTFYYPGLGSEGNDLFMEGDQPILTVRMLAENKGSDNVALTCTGPAICAYDVWDGSRAFKYSGMDFTNGQIVLKPGAHRVFNMLFGPNIGYGGTQFEHDQSRQYTFRISEPWGSAQIPISQMP